MITGLDLSDHIRCQGKKLYPSNVKMQAVCTSATSHAFARLSWHFIQKTPSFVGLQMVECCRAVKGWFVFGTGFESLV